jgi:hypothetical protein
MKAAVLPSGDSTGSLKPPPLVRVRWAPSAPV